MSAYNTREKTLLILKNKMSLKYAYNLNAIEKNTLTLQETDMVLRELTISQKSLKKHLEVIGHKETFEYVR